MTLVQLMVAFTNILMYGLRMSAHLFFPHLSVKFRGRLPMVTATAMAYYGTDGHEIQSFPCYLKKQSAFADCSVEKGGVRNGLSPIHDYKRRLEMKP
ncbi:hypothetical protein [Peribacillus sp. NPDC056705]|uniref:hypothetical protein n=1 Tax=Peribacillus sp. NPDC056705 TaxID=3345918 RepID=UPI003747AC31